MATIEEMARLAWPVLCEHAQAHSTLTYSALRDRIGHGASVGMSKVLERVRADVLQRKLPLLTTIVLNKDTSFPGENWHHDRAYYDLLPESKKRSLFESEKRKVFHYEGWDSALNSLGLHPIPLSERVLAPAPSYGYGGGEGERHLRLKLAVHAAPNIIGLPPPKRSTTEYLLPSGDEADVFFEYEASPRWHVVEVKVDDPGEIKRGAYQAVKYRALQCAAMGFDLDSNAVVAHLVCAATPDSSVAELCARYGIRLHVINESELPTPSENSA